MNDQQFNRLHRMVMKKTHNFLKHNKLYFISIKP